MAMCVDSHSGLRVPFLEIFSEDLLCHASPLSSGGFGLKLKINRYYFLATIAKILFSTCSFRLIFSLKSQKFFMYII